MNLVVMLKTLRDSRWMLVALPLFIVLFGVLFLRAISDIPAESGFDLLRLPIARRFLKTLLGQDLVDNLSATGLVSFVFVHPLVLASTWLLLLTVGSRVFAGEVDRGTSDLQFTLPASRAAIYVSVSVVMLIGAMLMAAAPLVGVALGLTWVQLWEPVDVDRLAMLIVNLFGLNIAVLGMTMWVSAASSRRGTPVAVVLSLLLTSFLLNFLSTFWEAAESLSFLGLLHYYKPLPIISSGAWPVRDLSILLGAGSATWLLGLWAFSRRDFPAA